MLGYLPKKFFYPLQGEWLWKKLLHAGFFGPLNSLRFGVRRDH